MDDNKITAISGGSTKDPAAETIRKMHANLPMYITHMQTMAALKKAKYDALLKEGFNEAQALELAKNIF